MAGGGARMLPLTLEGLVGARKLATLARGWMPCREKESVMASAASKFLPRSLRFGSISSLENVCSQPG